MAFVIPTVFTAVNQYSRPVSGMVATTNSFAGSLSGMTSRLDGAVKSLVAMGEAALIFGGVAYTGKKIMDYGTEIANLSAVTGATGAQLDVFKGKILDVAKATKKSSVDVAEAFTNVDNNMPALHTDAQGLAEVTEQAINLAKAGRMELGPAAESLTLSMNQFGLGADKAKAAIDALAGGAVAGSSKIAETSDALQVFGSVAANVAKVTYAESVAIVELASKFEKGAEAGTRIRNILLDMTNVKFGPAVKQVKALGVNMDLVSNTALPFIDRFKELSKIKGSPEAMEKLFDKRNVALASGLFAVIDNYEKVFKATSKVGTAEKMAATNTDTLAESLNQLRDAWITNVTTGGKANAAIDRLKGGVQFLTQHLDGLVSVAEDVIGVLLVWKGVNMALRGSILLVSTATKVLTIVQGISMAVTGNMTSLLVTSRAAYLSFAAATYVMSAGLWVSLGWISLVAGALTVLYQVISYNDDKQAFLNKQIDITKNGMKQLKPAINEATIAMREYNKAVDEYNGRVETNEYNKYMKKNHPVKYAINQIANPFSQAIMDSVYKPELKNFGDTTGKQAEYLPADSPEPITGHTQEKEKETAYNEKPSNLTITIDNKSGMAVNAKSDNGPIAVRIKETGTYNPYTA